MPETKNLQTSDQNVPTPHVVYGDINPAVSVDVHRASQTMQELGISDAAIGTSAIYIDPKNRLLNHGAHYPNRVGRLRFWAEPEIQEASGDIIRLSTQVRGKTRSEEQMNQTLVHELEHVAQQDRHDRKLTAGHIAIWGLAATGAVIGNRLGKNKASRTVGTALGAFLGRSIGEMIAPHERQARKRTHTVNTSAIRRSN